MVKILVTGANGQLGNELRALEKENPQFEFLFADIDEFDITDRNAVIHFFKNNRPDYLINCAAYTAVDKAETEKKMAMLVNEDAVKILNDACLQFNARIIHISTDYVFDGKNYKPYTENDLTHPLGVYGKSKLAGERKLSPFNSIILRTSWLYSSHGQNFIKTMLRISKEKDRLRVVSDQVGSPTYAADLAVAILLIIDHSQKVSFKPGIYHYANEGVCSWYDFAREILQLANISCPIDPIETKDYPLPAPRPHYSVLNKQKIRTTFSLSIPHWQESLKKCLEKIDGR